MHPHALFSRARRHGWDVETTPRPSGTLVTLWRGAWRLEVAFAGQAPRHATITGPGPVTSTPVNLRAINKLVRCEPGRIRVVAAAAAAGSPPARQRATQAG